MAIETVAVKASAVLPGDRIPLAEGSLLVDGDVYPSASLPGLVAVETEVGVLYLDPERTMEVIR